MISNHLHDHIGENDIIELTAPSGNFTLPDNQDAPVALISGGVGLTPLLSMLQDLADRQHPHPVAWLHGCRNENVHAFKEQVNEISSIHSDITSHIFYNEANDQQKAEGISEGYLDITSIPSLQLNPNTHFFICGPSVFITKQYNDLHSAGFNKERIYFEEFGPQLLSLN